MPTFLRSRVFFWSVLLAIMLFGFALRSSHIESTPAGLYPDEAMNGVDAISAMETGNYKLFYPNNYGREGLFINLQAFAMEFFGINVPALKIVSGIFGTLAVLGTGLLAWEIFRSRAAAFISSFLIATSFWAINFSRIGFRAIMVPALLAFTFYFFFRGLRRGKILPFAISGFLFGLGLHTYVAFRLAPLILVLLLPLLILSYESFLKRFWKHAVIFILFAFISAAPMFYAFATHPEIFSSRSAAVSIFSPEVNHGDFLGTFAKTLGLSLVKYNFFGDQNWRHNYPPYPILDPIVGTFFLAGLLFSIAMFVRILGARIREKRVDAELASHGLLLAGFFSMLAPEFLTEEGLPHALRAIGTQPFVFLLATIPILFIYRRFMRAHGGTKLAFFSFLLFVLAGSALWNTTKYFSLYAHHPAQHGAFNENYTAMAEYLLSLPKETHKYVYTNAGGTEIDNGLPISAQPIVFLTHDRVENLVFLRKDSDVMLETPGVIIAQEYDQRLFRNAKKLFPDASELHVDLRPGYGSDFTAIVLP